MQRQRTPFHVRRHFARTAPVLLAALVLTAIAPAPDALADEHRAPHRKGPFLPRGGGHRLGPRIQVETLVPAIPHRRVDVVIESLEAVYRIDVEPVRGPARLEGRVVGQRPRAGARLPFRGRLTLRVVDNRTTVPDVEGLGLVRARRRLERAGLVADIHEIPQRGIARPRVLRQRPRAGRRVRYDAAVHIDVAVPLRRRAHRPRRPDRTDVLDRGDHAAIVTVPNLRQMALGEALQLLRHFGLRADLPRRAASARDARIRAQTPLPGDRVARGSAVRLELIEARIRRRGGTSRR